MFNLPAVILAMAVLAGVVVYQSPLLLLQISARIRARAFYRRQMDLQSIRLKKLAEGIEQAALADSAADNEETAIKGIAVSRTAKQAVIGA